MMIYVHVPFCVRKCLYCDFLSFPVTGEQNVSCKKKEYLDALIKEIRATQVVTDTPVESIFFGGGTPSILEGNDIKRIMETIRASFSLAEDAEITLEANPGTVTLNKAAAWKEAGINRISLGVQALQDPLLKTLGRIHTKEDVLESVRLIKEAGFENFSLDLMFGLPGQTIGDWTTTLEEALSLHPKHLSCYSLILEEGTPFYEHREEYVFPGEDLEREMYHTAVAFLEKNGFHRYEISNFALPGYESKHNIGYWVRRPYFGFGLGAASLTTEEVRYNNTGDLSKYIECSGHVQKIRESVQKLSVSDQMEEFMFLGLRLADGVSKADFQKRFQKDIRTVYREPIQKHIANGLLEEKNGRLRLTPRGVDVSNVVMADFLIDENL